jgi:glycosyltransferase involved in cell wall biosynthesis
MGLAPNAVVVGHVGRFDPQKNHTFLLRIASELVSHEPSVRVLLIGDGPLRKSMESQAAALGLEDVVVFAGLRPDVSRLLLGAIDVFLFPSTHEGLPLTCTEAQAAAVPLVISDSITPELDAIPSLVTRLPLSESPAHWAEECLKAMSRPRIARGEAVRILEQSAFDIQICVRRLEDIYTRTNRQLLFADSPLSASCV